MTNDTTAPDVLGWLRTRAIADAAGDGAMFQEAATLLYDFKINAKALLIYCDSTGSGDAIYSLQCLRRLVERMESPNAEVSGAGTASAGLPGSTPATNEERT